jgi:hypothetical protein
LAQSRCLLWCIDRDGRVDSSGALNVYMSKMSQSNARIDPVLSITTRRQTDAIQRPCCVQISRDGNRRGNGYLWWS